MGKADRKTGWVSTPDGKNVPFAPTQDTPARDVEYDDARDAEVDEKKSHVPGMTDSD